MVKSYKGEIMTGQFFKIAQYENRFKNLGIIKKFGGKLVKFSVANSIPRGYSQFVNGTIEELVPPYEWVRWYHSAKNQSTEIRNEVLRAYERRYKNYINRIDIDELYSKITAHLGQFDRVILLCWERDDYPCHRHWIRDWFKYYGYETFEFKPPEI